MRGAGAGDADVDPGRFPVERSEVAAGLTLAYVRAGAGGRPLLLVHGWPETMRIWWRNIEPLAAAGFEVVVPDLRGFGGSDPAPDGAMDTASMSTDLHALMTGVLGHRTYAACGGDLGGVVIEDMAGRYPDELTRLCLFNTIPPGLGAEYGAAGIPKDGPSAATDYFLRQGFDADALAAELDTPEQRRRYIEAFYGHRFWAAAGSFDDDAAAFHAEPFADAGRLRTSFGPYEVACGTKPAAVEPRLRQHLRQPALILYGPEDHVIPPSFPAKMAVACDDPIGPFVVPGAGHFLMWERAAVLNRALAAFLGDR